MWWMTFVSLTAYNLAIGVSSALMAGFLLLTAPAATPELQEAIGELGLPYYVNCHQDARRPPLPRELVLPRPLPTGQLWWPVGA